jgi:hypothetical protein
MDNQPEHFQLNTLSMDYPGLWAYTITVPNGCTIHGKISTPEVTSEDDVSDLLQEQVMKANSRRNPHQKWQSWNWTNPETRPLITIESNP